MENCTEGVFQYYTIINAPTNTLNETGSNNQMVYLTIGQENEDLSRNIKTEINIESSDSEDTVQDSKDHEPSLGTNVKIITFEDGRMFMTAPEDETFETVEPHLITSEGSDHDANIDDDKSPENSNDTNYELVHVVGDTSQMYQMVYCDVGLSTEDEINTEKGKSFICLYEGCGKMYSVANDLNVHMRSSHMDCKPYVCTEDGCNKAFSTNYSLKAHIRTHTGEKPYACDVCQKCFKTSGDLQKHHRIHTGEKPFLCPIDGCGKSFTTSNIRKVHIRSHTGERPYTCTYPNCGKAFSSSTNFKNHTRIHSGEKPYMCNFKECGKRFTEYSSLYKHNLVHQFDRPYTCVFCGQKFKQDSAMKLHKRVRHNVIVASDGIDIVMDLN